jgi:predicted RNA-binding protein with PIN domain
MIYYIDGYNLIFRILRASDDLKSRREKIIKDLNTKVELLDLTAIIVFDAQYQFGDAYRSHYKQLEILFTDENETADESILRSIKLADKPEKCIVVTSDKRLALAVRRRGAKTQTVEEFMLWLVKRVQNKKRKQKLPIEKKEPPQKLPDPSTISRPEEGSLEYYLQIFEERLKNLD